MIPYNEGMSEHVTMVRRAGTEGAYVVTCNVCGHLTTKPTRSEANRSAGAHKRWRNTSTALDAPEVGTITGRTLTAALRSARAAGWTVERQRQTTDLTRDGIRFVIFHATDPARFDHAYRVDRQGNFGHSFASLHRLVARLNSTQP